MFCGECGVSVATPKLVEPATKPRPGDTAIIQRLDLPSTEFIGDVKTEAAKPVSTEPELVKPARPRPTARPKPVPPAAPAVTVPPAPAPPAAPVPSAAAAAPAARITLPPKPMQPKPTQPTTVQPTTVQNVVAPLIPTPPTATSVTPVVDVPQTAPAGDDAPAGLPRDLEETRIVASRLGDRFVLQFSTGENSTVYGTGLVGRNPVTQPGEYVDQLVTILDPGKSVSKTHLEFGQTAGAFWVVDRYSANGTIVRQPDAPPQRLDPGKRQPVARGTRVDMGEQFFVVS